MQMWSDADMQNRVQKCRALLRMLTLATAKSGADKLKLKFSAPKIKCEGEQSVLYQ